MIDELVAIAKERVAFESARAEKLLALESDDVSFCGTTPSEAKLHVYHGIKRLADEGGATLKRHGRDSSDYAFEYSFEHDGVLFYQISNLEVPE